MLQAGSTAAASSPAVIRRSGASGHHTDRPWSVGTGSGPATSAPSAVPNEARRLLEHLLPGFGQPWAVLVRRAARPLCAAALTRAEHHLGGPVDQQRLVGPLPAPLREAVVAAFDHPVGK